MSCELTEQVSLLIDGELPPVEARAIERHLLECAECRQVRVDFVNLRSQISTYVATPARALPPRLTHILSSREQAGTASTRNGRSLGLFFPRRWNPAFGAVAGMLLIVFAIALTLHVRSQRSQKGQQPTVTATGTVTSGKTNVPTLEAPAPQPVDGIAGSSTPSSPVMRNQDQKKSDSQRRETVTRVRPRAEEARLKRDRTTRFASQPKTTKDATETLALDSTSTGGKSLGPVRSVDTQTLTAQHVEQSELLLRSFRNLRSGSRATKEDLVHERRRAQRLFYQNVLLRREADSAGDVELATLLEHLEPILLDIANLPEGAQDNEVRVIKDRLQRQNLVALLQVNSTGLARSF